MGCREWAVTYAAACMRGAEESFGESALSVCLSVHSGDPAQVTTSPTVHLSRSCELPALNEIMELL